jgi:teichuronic acid biosynthesis glycosyltransferase TuaC
VRLLFIANDYPTPEEPSKGVFNLYLAQALARGNEVRVVAPFSWVSWFRHRQRPSACKLAGVEIYHPVYYYPPKVLRATYGWFLWQSVRRTISRLISSWRPDVVLAYWAHPDGDVAVRIARQLGVPSAVIVGGSDILILPRDRLRRRCVARVLTNTDAVLTVSADLKSKVVDLGISPERVHLWHQGVDVTRFTAGDRAKARRRLGLPVDGLAAVWVGRMVPVKGLEVLLSAFALIQSQYVSARLYLVGDGPLRPGLEAMCMRLGLSESVSFVGSTLHDQLPDWYRAADLTVLPSWSEGLPNVLRESLACGTPFVASNVGGIPEIAAGNPARLVPPGDPEALAAALAATFATEKQEWVPASRVISWDESAENLLRIMRRQVSNMLQTRLGRLKRPNSPIHADRRPLIQAR